MKAHRTDLVSLAFGLVFLALSVWWLLARILGLTLPPVGWFLAGALILIGVLGLAGALRSGRHADRDTAGTDAETTVSAPYEGGPEWTPPVAPEADEWRTDAVGDDAAEAVADRPVSGGAGESRWSPSAPPTDPGTSTDATTREQPTVDLGPTSPGRSTVGDAPATRQQRAAGAGPAAGPDGEER